MLYTTLTPCTVRYVAIFLKVNFMVASVVYKEWNCKQSCNKQTVAAYFYLFKTVVYPYPLPNPNVRP